MRGLYILDQNLCVKYISCSPMANGRCFEEVLRMLDSLILTRRFQHLGTPAGWMDMGLT